VGRGVGKGLTGLGRAGARAAGRAREIDPAHRRDGLGVLFLGLALVTAAGVWWGAGGPVGQWLSGAVASVIGRGAAVLPVVLLGVGLLLVAAPANPETRPRIAIGSGLLALGGLGLVHLFSGAPVEPAEWGSGGGAIGYLAATPLATGLTAWVAVPVLLLVSVYALLLLIGTPVREVPDRLRRLIGRVPPDDEEYDDDTADVVAEEDEPAVAPLRRPTRRRQASRAADAYRDEEPAEPAEPAVAEAPPTPPPPRRRPAAVVATPPAEPEQPDVAAGEQLRLTVSDREGEPPYALPPSDLLPTGPVPKTRSSANDAMIESITGVLEQFSVDAQVTGFTRGPDRHALRDRAGPGGQGREDHPADEEHLLRRRHRQRPDPRARSRASRPWASRCPTPTARWSAWATCCAPARRARSSTRW
jgi:S-DNA-T family DNA segregation ATPase FtsK/SpoIIIE